MGVPGTGRRPNVKKRQKQVSTYALIAQPVERILGKDEVAGSNPALGSIITISLGVWQDRKDRSLAEARIPFKREATGK